MTVISTSKRDKTHVVHLWAQSRSDEAANTDFKVQLIGRDELCLEGCTVHVWRRTAKDLKGAKLNLD